MGPLHVFMPPPRKSWPSASQGWADLAYLPSSFLICIAVELCFIFPLVFALLMLRIEIHCLELVSSSLE